MTAARLGWLVPALLFIVGLVLMGTDAAYNELSGTAGTLGLSFPVIVYIAAAVSTTLLMILQGRPAALFPLLTSLLAAYAAAYMVGFNDAQGPGIDWLTQGISLVGTTMTLFLALYPKTSARDKDEDRLKLY